MIYTNRKVTVRNGVSTIDAPIILYRGDKEVDIKFEIKEPLVIEEEMLPEDDENSVYFRRLYYEDTDLPDITINLEGGINNGAK